VTAIEEGVLKQFEHVLVEEKRLQPEFAKTVRAETGSDKGPNSERLANLFKKAGNGRSA
jgi:hypothetical protein